MATCIVVGSGNPWCVTAHAPSVSCLCPAHQLLCRVLMSHHTHGGSFGTVLLITAHFLGPLQAISYPNVISLPSPESSPG